MHAFLAATAVAVILTSGTPGPARPQKYARSWSVESEITLYNSCYKSLVRQNAPRDMAHNLCMCGLQELEDLATPEASLDTLMKRGHIAAKKCIEKLKVQDRVEPGMDADGAVSVSVPRTDI